MVGPRGRFSNFSASFLLSLFFSILRPEYCGLVRSMPLFEKLGGLADYANTLAHITVLETRGSATLKLINRIPVKFAWSCAPVQTEMIST
jgi:hypothetical protein